MKPGHQRVMRVLVYEGEPAWLKDAMERRGVKDVQVVSNVGRILEVNTFPGAFKKFVLSLLLRLL